MMMIIEFTLTSLTATLCVSKRIDLVDGVARRPARLPVEVVALNEHRVVGLAPDPHVALPHKVQLSRKERKGAFKFRNFYTKFISRTTYKYHEITRKRTWMPLPMWSRARSLASVR